MAILEFKGNYTEFKVKPEMQVSKINSSHSFNITFN